MGNQKKKALIISVFVFYCVAQVLSFALFPAKTVDAKAVAKPKVVKQSELPSIALTHEPRLEEAVQVSSSIDSEAYVAPKPVVYATASYNYIPKNEIEKMIIDMGGNQTLIKIMYCESQGNPRAKNPTSSASGLFQFLDTTWRGMGGSTQRSMDASVEEQIRLAIKLYNRYGPTQWSCYR